MHFPRRPEINEEYFKQLTAEKQITKFTRGFPKKEWVKTRARNEVLDCEVYALAALSTLHCDLDQLASRMESRAALPKKEPKPKTPSRNFPARWRPVNSRGRWSSTRW